MAIGKTCPGAFSNVCKKVLPEDASKGLRCPICLKQAVVSVWCSQECFQANYSSHKSSHKTHDPFKKSFYTGPLRACYPIKVKSVPNDVERRPVPDHIVRPDYVLNDGIPISEQAERPGAPPKCLNAEEIKGMREVCRLAREVLDLAASHVRPGITPLEIDEVVHNACIERNAYPSPLGYHGYPRSVCISVNEVICHGIPDLRPLEKEDIVNLDVTLYHGGFHGDLNATYPVDPKHTPPDSLRLIKTTRECLDEAIAMCKPGVAFKDLGKTIERIADREGFGVNRRYSGHGINQLFHCSPTVSHYAGNKTPYSMKPGMTFTIEPMITIGDHRDKHWPDNWTAVTKDGLHTAQFEETLLVTEDGVDVITAAPGWKLGDGWKEKEGSTSNVEAGTSVNGHDK